MVETGERRLERGTYLFVGVGWGGVGGETFPGYGGLQGVGEGVFEEAEEVGVTDGALHVGDGIFDFGEGELAASWGWALIGKLVAAFG